MPANAKSCFDQNWQAAYAGQIASPAEAARQIKPGHRVFIGTGCGQPQELVQAMVRRVDELADTEIVHLLTLGAAPYAQKELADRFRVNSFFISENVREVIHEGYGSYTPIFLSEIPRLFSSGQLPLDVALIQVTPPDERGFCSLGVSVDIVKSAAENAALVIAEVNPQMPYTCGDSRLHVHDLDVLVPVDHPILEFESVRPDETTRQIGQNVSSLIDDGATVELGIGKVPQAVLECLVDKKDLGIHTEMFTDSMIDAIENGTVTGARKSLDRNRVVASFCMGTRRLYDYINNNSSFCFRPTEAVNDPYQISQIANMIAVNVALQIDLTGQVCADSLGTRFFSGIGGQVDFNRGAARSPGGKAIIAMPSTAKDETISRIVVSLSPGAGVVTTRGDVHYVATEFGIAYLHGKTIEDRAIALISIAHPKFRAALMEEAIQARYIREDFRDVEGRIHIGSRELTTPTVLTDGTLVKFRPIHPTDEPRMRDLFYHLSRQTVYYRFMKDIKSLPHKQIRDFVYVDHRNEVAIVGTVPEAHGEEIVAIGRYYLDSRTNRAEVAFVVQDQWQNKGLGTFLLKFLTTIARRNGIAGFTAEVLRENHPMQAVLHKSGHEVHSSLQDDVYSFEVIFR